NAELESHFDFLESELRAFRDFRYSAFKEANERAAQLEKERDALTLSLNECVGRALDLVPAVFKNALDQVELYLRKLLPRDKFSYKHYVKDGKL
ncbi:hypothetical protein A2U01_0077402, partial [Trifolium medium]|nr:hypothetical protein [Trifolium medium]